MIAQTKTIWMHMKKFATISPLEALKKYGCMRLAARIYDLKERGCLITRQIVVNHKTKKRYAEYSLKG